MTVEKWNWEVRDETMGVSIGTECDTNIKKKRRINDGEVGRVEGVRMGTSKKKKKTRSLHTRRRIGVAETTTKCPVGMGCVYLN